MGQLVSGTNADLKTASRMVVVGFGKTGRALLDFILAERLGRDVWLYNDTVPEDAAEVEKYKNLGVRFLFGEAELIRLTEMDMILISPGVDARHERFSVIRDSGTPILSEIEFACRFFNADIIAVTGTNGKSTTVSLIDFFLKNHGIQSVLAGNIGNPLIGELPRISDGSVVVLEVSSFQLEEIQRFRPHVAVLLNVTPDHLDRYGSMAEYTAAKFNIFKNLGRDDFLILNGDDPSLDQATTDGAEVIHFSATQRLRQGYFYYGGAIEEIFPGEQGQISLAGNPLVGVHNLENLLAATAVARLYGVERREIEVSLKNFRGLPHRMEWVGRVDRIDFINDSKATNVDAALKSIQSLTGPAVVILGGKDKGGDFSTLQEVIEKKIQRVLLVGQAADTIYRQIPAVQRKCVRVSNLKEAVASGCEILETSGGVVLLAPGCASFDMFDSFEHRGEVFRREVLTLQKGTNG